MFSPVVPRDSPLLKTRQSVSSTFAAQSPTGPPETHSDLLLETQSRFTTGGGRRTGDHCHHAASHPTSSRATTLPRPQLPRYPRPPSGGVAAPPCTPADHTPHTRAGPCRSRVIRSGPVLGSRDLVVSPTRGAAASPLWGGRSAPLGLPLGPWGLPWWAGCCCAAPWGLPGQCWRATAADA